MTSCRWIASTHPHLDHLPGGRLEVRALVPGDDLADTRERDVRPRQVLAGELAVGILVREVVPVDHVLRPCPGHLGDPRVEPERAQARLVTTCVDELDDTLLRGLDIGRAGICRSGRRRSGPPALAGPVSCAHAMEARSMDIRATLDQRRISDISTSAAGDPTGGCTAQAVRVPATDGPSGPCHIAYRSRWAMSVHRPRPRCRRCSPAICPSIPVDKLARPPGVLTRSDIADASATRGHIGSQETGQP